MLNISYTITPGGISLFYEGRPRIIPKGALNYNDVLQTLTAAISFEKHRSSMSSDMYAAHAAEYKKRFAELLDIPLFVARVSEGRIQIGDTGVLFDGRPMHGVASSRLVSLLTQGHDVRPLARFLDRLHYNPTLTAIDEVYLFLESGNLPLTDDGCFLAFKKVRGDYASSTRDARGNEVYNRIGSTVSMDRDECDPDRNETCSRGLHFCSFAYLPSFGVGGESKVVVVKVAPEDVVAIPSDYNNTKGRTWKYDIIGEVPEDECEHLFREVPVVSTFGIYDNREDDEAYDPFYDEEDDNAFQDQDTAHARPQADCQAETGFTGCEAQASDEAVCDDDGCDGDRDTYTPSHVFSHTTVEGRVKVFADRQVKDGVAKYGQRGWSRLTGIPRSTIQGWLSQLGL